jgi:hypothetical protein
MNLSPAEKREQELRRCAAKLEERYAIWVMPCYHSEHSVNREGGYLTFEQAAATWGCPYVTRFGNDIAFFKTRKHAEESAQRARDFIVSGYSICRFEVFEFAPL